VTVRITVGHDELTLTLSCTDPTMQSALQARSQEAIDMLTIFVKALDRRFETTPTEIDYRLPPFPGRLER
jgi:hypothetical protein